MNRDSYAYLLSPLVSGSASAFFLVLNLSSLHASIMMGGVVLVMSYLFILRDRGGLQKYILGVMLVLIVIYSSMGYAAKTYTDYQNALVIVTFVSVPVLIGVTSTSIRQIVKNREG